MASEPGIPQANDGQSTVLSASQPSDAVAPTVAVSDTSSAVELAISDDYLQAGYFTGGGLLGVDQAQGHVGFYFSDGRDLIGNIGMMSEPLPLLNERLAFSAGFCGYLALLSDPDDDVFGLAPGVEVRYVLPFAYPVDAVGSLFYAPDTLTLGDIGEIK